ncbi:MAG: hypothetical protein PHP37_03595 [Patescibacteria group bacterium]|nr:hypothetical protein [Patescibacteria group bacterium]
MLFELSNKLQSIIDLEKNQIAGFFNSAVFDPEKGKLIALLVKTNIFKKKIILPVDNLQIGAGVFAVKTKQILEYRPYPKIQRLVEKEIPIINQRVKTESGKYLGKVSSVLIEDAGFYIVKLYLNSPSLSATFLSFMPNSATGLVINREDILQIGPKAIIVENDSAKKVDVREVAQAKSIK